MADTNLIVYFLVRGEHSAEAERVYQKDRDWVAPVLWRSELWNTLAVYLRRGLLQLEEAVAYARKAEALVQCISWRAGAEQVLRLAAASGCATYDCEFVVVAQQLGVPLVTSDELLLSKFKSTAISMQGFSA